MKEIVLKRDVRCFSRGYGPQSLLLTDTGRFLLKGDQVWVGEPVTMSWDNRDVLVVPFEWQGNSAWLLHEEVASSLDINAAPLFSN
ncbi:MAG: hypothetical protein KGJ13_03200 [Patescibacteria group bacterium]|nr:hypothetical protein [Patescibacteria group bacterium]